MNRCLTNAVTTGEGKSGARIWTDIKITWADEDADGQCRRRREREWESGLPGEKPIWAVVGTKAYGYRPWISEYRHKFLVFGQARGRGRPIGTRSS